MAMSRRFSDVWARSLQEPQLPQAWKVRLWVAGRWDGGWSGVRLQQGATVSKTRLLSLKTAVTQQEQRLLCVCG